MPMFRLKKSAVEAHQVPPDPRALPEDFRTFLHGCLWGTGYLITLAIKTPDGWRMAKPGDWIVRQKAGEYLIHTHEYFTSHYTLELVIREGAYSD